jgi:hypothetical protein
MKTNSANLTLEIPDRALAQSLLQRWSERPRVSVKILRGRVSPDLAHFELEIRGAAAEVARILRQSATWAPSREPACVI